MLILLTKARPIEERLARLAARRSGRPEEPTPAQLEAGNYAKRKLAWRGLTISIENEAGSTRTGVGPGGRRWSTPMHYAYGYINGSRGVDGDQVDVYLGPDLEGAATVYVVHQRKAGEWGAYDEDKAMIGWKSEAEARAAYLGQYDDSRFMGPITAMPVEQFVEKVRATKDRPGMIKSRGGLVLLLGKAVVT